MTINEIDCYYESIRNYDLKQLEIENNKIHCMMRYTRSSGMLEDLEIKLHIIEELIEIKLLKF